MAFQVAEPARHREGQQLDGAAPGQRFAHGGQHEFRDARRALRADARQLVAHGRIRKALDQGSLVPFQIDAFHAIEQRRDLVIHHAPHEQADARVKHRFMRKRVAELHADVAQGLVAGIQETQLHLFIRQHVVRHLRPHLFPGRAALREFVFDDPLAERLAHDGPGVDDAKRLAQQRPVFIGGGRRDAVDHAVGEAAMRGQPARQFTVAQGDKGQQHLARHVAIVLQVITRHDGKGRQAPLMAQGQRGGQVTERAARRLRVRQFMHDVRVLRVEFARALVDVVAALGDGQRDDARAGVGQFFQHGLWRVGRIQILADAANDACGIAGRAALDHCVQAVLRLHGVAHGRVGRQQAHAAIAPLRMFLARQGE